MSYDEINKINNRLSPNVKLYLMKLIQHVPNIDITFFGSITNFTYIENHSDVDCAIVYHDEISKMKLIQFITDDLLQFDIKNIKHMTMRFNDSNHNDEYQDVYMVTFDNRDKIDLNLIPDKIGPIIKNQHDSGILILCFRYIFKWLYVHEIISKDTWVYLKGIIHAIRDWWYQFHITKHDFTNYMNPTHEPNA
jgi:hypothetical protein